MSLYIVQFVWSINVLLKFNFFKRTLNRKNVKKQRFSNKRHSKEKNEFRKNVIQSIDLVPFLFVTKNKKNLRRICLVVLQKSSSIPIYLNFFKVARWFNFSHKMIFILKRNSDKFRRHTRQTPFKVTQHDNKGTNDRQTTKTFNFVSYKKNFFLILRMPVYIMPE